MSRRSTTSINSKASTVATTSSTGGFAITPATAFARALGPMWLSMTRTMSSVTSRSPRTWSNGRRRPRRSVGARPARCLRSCWPSSRSTGGPGLRLGRELLVLVLTTIVEAARVAGGKVLVADAIDEATASFYALMTSSEWPTLIGSYRRSAPSPPPSACHGLDSYAVDASESAGRVEGCLASGPSSLSGQLLDARSAPKLMVELPPRPPLVPIILCPSFLPIKSAVPAARACSGTCSAPLLTCPFTTLTSPGSPGGTSIHRPLGCATWVPSLVYKPQGSPVSPEFRVEPTSTVRSVIASIGPDSGSWCTGWTTTSLAREQAVDQLHQFGLSERDVRRSEVRHELDAGSVERRASEDDHSCPLTKRHLAERVDFALVVGEKGGYNGTAERGSGGVCSAGIALESATPSGRAAHGVQVFRASLFRRRACREIMQMPARLK